MYVLILLLVIFIEGYIVLSSELIAIRLTVPYVGSGSDTVSVIIAAVLMPLAFGYYAGGRFKPYMRPDGTKMTVRRKLIRNIVTAAVILLPALCYVTVGMFFEYLAQMGITHRLLMVTIYSIIFFVYPVYLLGQTVPLVSNFFSHQKLARITGKMLCFSTIGSFLGAIFSTLVMMSFFGVTNAVIFNFVLFLLLAVLLEKSMNAYSIKILVVVLGVALYLNSSYIAKEHNIVEENHYNTIQVVTHETGTKDLIINGNGSSRVDQFGMPHDYILFMELNFIDPILEEGIEPKKILVIGAGGFTLGLGDEKNDYTYVDIDGSLLEVSEKYFLEEKLGENKRFVPLPARAFLNQSNEKYDLIVLDAYFGDITIPEHLVTQNFFLHVKEHLAVDGRLVANFILSATYQDAFSRNIDVTLRSVFPFVGRDVVGDFDGWTSEAGDLSNIIYYYSNHEYKKEPRIYTDNRNGMFFDKPQKKF